MSKYLRTSTHLPNFTRLSFTPQHEPEELRLAQGLKKKPARKRSLLFLFFLLFSIFELSAQPVWFAGFPQLRRESRSFGMGVRFTAPDVRVYYVVYNTAVSDPGPGAFTAAAIKANTTPALGKVLFGNFNWKDVVQSYCDGPPPGCPVIANQPRFFSVYNMPPDNLPTAGSPTFRVYFTAEFIAAPVLLTAPQDRTVTPTNNSSCLKVGSLTNPPDVGKNKAVLNICSPSNINLTVTYTGVDGFAFNAGTGLPDNKAQINWGDATPLTPYTDLTLVNLTERNKEYRRYEATVLHTYLGSSNTASNPPGSQCTFHLDMDLVLVTPGPGTTICTLTNQDEEHTVYDDPGQRGIQDVNPNGPDAADEEFEVCAQDRTAVNLLDASEFNCTDYAAGNGNELGRIPPNPNNGHRWVQFVYGAAGTNVTNGAPAATSAEKVTINGVDFDNTTTWPIYGPVQYLTAPILQPTSTALSIRMPTLATTGQLFVVEMRSWNICREYDSNVGDGNPLDPVGGVFDVGANVNTRWFGPGPGFAYPGNGTLFPDASEAPVVLAKNIIIINKPPTPVANSKEFCAATVLNPPAVACAAITVPNQALSWELTAASVAGSNTISWYFGGPPGTGVFVANTYGVNCRFFRSGALVTGVAQNAMRTAMGAATTGVYSLYATYTIANGCVSDPIETKLTIRPALATPGAPIGTSPVCNGSTLVGYSQGGASGTVTIPINTISNPAAVNFPTQYFWSTSAADVTVSSTTGTAITANFAITEPAPPTTSTTRNIRTAREFSAPAPLCTTANGSLTVTVDFSSNGGAITPNATICDGTSTGTMTVTANSVRGTILEWQRQFNAGAFVAIAGTAGLTTYSEIPPNGPGTYKYRLRVQNGTVCIPATTIVANQNTITVNATPPNANAGADQLGLCFVAPPLTATLAGNNPAPGAGAWTRVSGPGAAPTFAPGASTPGAAVTVFANGTHVFRWTVQNGGVCITTDDVTLDFGTAPTVPNAGVNQDVCGLVATLAGTTPTYETGTWSQTAGPGVTAFTPTVNTPGAVATATVLGTYTYRWRFTSGGCPVEEDFVDVIFRNPPTVSAPADFTSCLDNPPTAPFNINLSGTFGGGASQARWERVAGSGVFSSSGAANGNFDATNPVDDVYVPTAADFAAGSVQVRLITDDPVGGCAAVNDPVTITIDRRPSNAAAGPDFSTCNTTEVFAATAANNGGTGTWSVGNALYYETFPTPDNGIGIAGPPVHATTFNHPSGNWSLSLPANNIFLDNQDWLKVDGGGMKARDVNLNEVVWTSRIVNILAFPSVSVSAQITESGVSTGADYIRVFYKINGGAEIQFGAVVGDLGVDGQLQNVNVSGLAGNDIQIVMRARNDGLNDFHFLDNVFISGVGGSLPLISDINSPTATVSNLNVGTNTFTWTVTSALGVCSSTNDQVVITRHALPVANDPAPALCEDSFGSADALVTPAFLITLNDGVTGIVGSVGRTVTYFSDAARTIVIAANFQASNAEQIYSRVTRTDVVPGCTQDGVVTFTVNSRPVATNQAPEFCEESFGSADKDNVNLTLNNTAITGGAANRTVAWFLDAPLTTPVPSPTDVDDVTNTETFFALVTNTISGCTNTAQAIYVINPRPIANAITGPANVCSGTSIILYQITNIIPGTTYAWTLPPDNPGFFERFAGGGVNDFFVLLQFENLIVPPISDLYNISVVETSLDGCVGPSNAFAISVNDAPPANVITGPDPVCKNETGVTYAVVPNPTSNFSWSVSSGDAAIVGAASGPNLFQVTVDFGTSASSTLEVIETSGSGCVGAPATLIINANDPPAMTSLPTATLCSGTMVSTVHSFSSTIPLTTFGWQVINVTGIIGGTLVGNSGIGNIGETLTNSTAANGSVTYRVIPTSPAGCAGPFQDVVVTVMPEPVGVDDPSPAICSDANVAYSLQNNINTMGNGLASTFSWVALANAFVTGESTVPQASGTISDVLNNVTNVNQSVVYTVTPTGTNGCLGNDFTVTVTVRPEPVGAADVTTINSDIALAYDLQVANINTLGNSVLSTFSWVATANPSVSGESTTAQAGGVINNTLNNVTNSNQTVIYTVTPTGTNGCPGNNFTVTVTVLPEPVGAPDTKTIDSDFAVNYDLQVTNINILGNSLPATFVWVATANPNVSGESVVGQPTGTITDILNNVTAVDQTVVYTVTPTGTNGVLGNPFVISIIVKPEPLGLPDTKTICSDASVSYNIQVANINTLGNGLASTFSWIAIDNPQVTGESLVAQATGTINNVLNNVTNVPQDVIYTVTPTGTNGVLGNNFTVTVTVQPEPVGAADTKTVCSDVAVAYDLQVSNINTLGNGLISTFSWVAAANPNVTGESTTAQASGTINDVITNVTSSNQTVLYTVTPSSGGCPGNNFIVSVTVQPEPVGVADLKTICSDANVAYDLQVTNINGLGNGLVSTFTWIAAANPNVTGESTVLQAGGIINDVLNNVTNTNQTVVYTASPTSGGCVGNNFTVSVTVQPEPVGAADVANICSDASVGYNLQVTNINGLGNGLTSTFSWVAAPNGSVTGESTVPQASGVINDVLNNVTNGNQIVVYTVTPTGTNGCAGNDFFITVTVRPEPLGISDVKTVCSDVSVNYDLQVTNIDGLGNALPSTFSWVAAANPNVTGESTVPQATGTITDVINNVTSFNQAVIYTVTPTGTNGCLGNAFFITVTVQPEPVGANSLKTAVCSDVAFNFNPQLDVSNGVVSTFAWTAAYPGGLTGGAGVGVGAVAETLTNLTGAALNAVYTVTPTASSGSCGGSTFTITVPINPEPVGANSVKAAVCSDVAFSFNPQLEVTNGSASTFSWIASYAAGITGGAVTGTGNVAETLTNLTGGSLNAVYTITPTATLGSCVGSTFTITVPIQPEPVGANATKPAVCSDVVFSFNPQLDITNAVASTFTWSAIYAGGLTGGAGAGVGNVAETLTNLTSGILNAVYTVTPTASTGSCLGSNFTITVPISPEPVGLSAAKAAVCSDVAFSFNPQADITNGVTSTFTWTAAYPGGLTGGAGAGTGFVAETLTNITGGALNAVYTITPSALSGSCVGTVFTITVPINPEPLGTNSIKATVCSDAAFNFNPQVDITNGVTSTFTWTAAYGVGLTGGAGGGTGNIAESLNNITGAVRNAVYTVTPTASTGSCVGSSFTITVPVNSEPLGANSTKTAVCSDVAFSFDPQLDISNGVTSTFAWTAAYAAGITGGAGVGAGAVAETLTNLTGGILNATYTVTPTATLGSCVGSTFTITVPIRPEPVGANVSKAAVCSDVAFSFNPQSDITNGVTSTFAWTGTYPAGLTGGAGGGTGTIAETLTNLTGGQLSASYLVVPTASTGSCVGSSFTITVPINPEPLGSNSLKAAVCSDVAFSFDPQVDIANGVTSTFSWTAAYGVGLTGGAGGGTGNISETLNNTTGGVRNAVYTVIPTATTGSCVGSSFTITVPINSEPVGANSIKTAVCSDVAFSFDPQLDITNGVTSTFAWTAVYAGGLTGGAGAGVGPTAETLTNLTGGILNAVYTITPTATTGSCVGTTYTITVPIRPEPVGANSTKAAVCSDVAFSFNPQSDIANGVTSTFTWSAAYAGGLIGGAGAGAGAIAETLTNLTGGQLNATYTVTPTASTGGCLGSTFVITVPIDTEPVGNNSTKAAQCSDVAFTFDPQADITNGVTSNFSWTALYDPGLTGGVGSGTGSVAGTLTNLTGGILNAVYNVTPTSTGGGCVGTAYTITVPVNSEPVGANSTKAAVCSDVAFSFDPQLDLINGVPSTFTWTAVYDPGLTGGAAGGVGPAAGTLTNLTSGTLNVVYTITPTATTGSCLGSTFTITVPVRPEPVGVNSTKAVVCSDVSFSFNPQGDITNGVTSTFTWIASYAGGITGGAGAGVGFVAETLTNLTGGVLNAVYTITPTATAGGCVGSTYTITVPIGPEPVGASSLKASVCSDVAFNFNPQNEITNAVVSTFAWTAAYGAGLTGGSGSGTGTIAETLTNLTGGALNAVYTITPSALSGGCPGTAFTITVPINPEPVGVTSTKAAVCSDIPFSFDPQLDVSNGIASTFTWIGAYGLGLTGGAGVGVGVISETLNNVSNSVKNAVYTITPTATAGSCVGSTFTITVPINPEPIGANTTKAAVCSDVAFSFNPQTDVTNTVASTFAWSALYDPGLTGGATNGIGLVAETLTNLTSSVRNATYTITPTATTGACIGTAFTMVVPINPEPVGANSTKTAVCSDVPFSFNPQLDITNGVAGNFTWTVVYDPGLAGGSGSGSGAVAETLTNLTTLALNATYTVTPTAVTGNCVGTDFTIIVPIDPEPVGVNATKAAVCSDIAFSFDPQLDITNGITSSFTWTAIYDVGLTGGAVNGTGNLAGTLTNLTSLVKNATYIVTPTAAPGGCVGTAFTIIVPVDAEPLGANSTKGAVCSDTPFNFDPQLDIINGVASTFTWIAAYPAGLTGGAGAGVGNVAEALNNVSTGILNAVYTISPVSGAGLCIGNTFTITVPIRPEPLGTSNTKAAVCSDAAFSFNPQVDIANTVTSTFTWTAVYDAGLTGGAGAGAGLITETLTNLTGATLNATYTVTPTASTGSCLGSDFTIIVPVTSEPVGANSLKGAVCSDVAFSFDPQADITNGVTSSFTWTASYPAGVSGGVGAGSGLIAETLSNTMGGTLIVSYSVTPSSTTGSCPGTLFTISVPIDPEPVMDPALSTNTVCSRSILSITLNTNGVSVAAATYNITLVSQAAGLVGVPTTGAGLLANAIFNDSFTNTGSVPLAVVYQVVPVSASPCVGNAFNITVNVNPEPVVNPSLDNAVCSDDISNIIMSTNGTSVGAASYRLINVTIPGTVTANAGNTIIGTTTGINLIRNDRFTNITAAFAVVTYEVIGISPSGCLGQSEFIDLTINPEPVLDPLLSPAPVCSGVISSVTLGVAAGSVGALTYSINNIIVDVGLVVVTNSGIGPGKPANAIFNDVYTNPTNSNKFVTYFIVPVSAAGCVGDEATVILTIQPGPFVDNALNKTACNDDTAGSGIVFSTETSPLSIGAASYNILAVTIQAGLTQTAGNTGVRMAVAANEIQGDRFQNLTNGPLSVTYSVQGTSGAGCLGPALDIVLTVEPVIDIDAMVNPTICSGSAVAVTLQSTATVPTSGGITFRYNSVPSSGLISGNSTNVLNVANGSMILDALTNNANSPGTVTYTINADAALAKNGQGCTSTPAILIATIEPKPKVTATPSSKDVCEGVSPAIALSTATIPGAGTMEFLLAKVTPAAGVTGNSAVGTIYAPGSQITDLLTSTQLTPQAVVYKLLPRFNGGLGCVGDSVQVVVNVKPIPNINPGTQLPICSEGQINIDINSDIPTAVATWTASALPATIQGASPGAGPSITQTLINTGNVDAVVTYTISAVESGCGSTPPTIRTVTVRPKPAITVPTTQNVCHGMPLTITPTSTVAGSSFTWTVSEDGSLNGAGPNIPLPSTNTTGVQITYTYEVTGIEPGDACPGLSKFMIVNLAPEIIATFLPADAICQGSSAFVVAEIVGQAPFNIDYTINGGVPIPRTAFNVTVIQDAPVATSTYAITRVRDALGCQINPPGPPSVSVNVGINNANFSIVSATSACSPFPATYQFDQAAGTTYTWRWGDGLDSTFLAAVNVPGQTVSHTYSNLSPTSNATYKVFLQTELDNIIYPAGCFKITNRTVTVFPEIIPNVTAVTDEICAGETVQFIDLTLGASIKNWSYRVLGSVPETPIAMPPGNAFAFPGTGANPVQYEVIYRTNNASNCPAADILVDTISVYRNVTAGFNEGVVPDFINLQSIVTFTNTSNPIDGTDFDYNWDFGFNADIQTSTSTGPVTVTFIQNPGPRQVTLTVTNQDRPECMSVFTKVININVPPIGASFTLTPLEFCFPGTLSVISNIQGDVNVIQWRVLDGNGALAATSSAVDPIFQLPYASNFTVSLTVSNSFTAQSATAVPQTALVYAKPLSSFDVRPDIVFVPDQLLETFNFSSGASQYFWDFGDGGSSTDFQPTYSYQIEGIYDVSLIASEDHGGGIICSDTLTRKVTAKQGGLTKVPNAFTPSPNGPSGGVPGNNSFNDVFLPIIKGAIEFNMQIFDRWGNLIFESNDANIGWDGYDNQGRIMPASVYVYKLTLRLSDNQRTTQIGDITLIR